MATEDEEFEFRLRLEQEQAQEAAQNASGRRETSLAGVGSEMGKGAVRGAVGAADTANMIERVMPVTGLLRRGAEVLAPDITRRVGESIKAFRERLLEQNRADPNASRAEQMLGTGAELATQATLTGGPGGGVRQTLMNTLVPAVGGALGEQAFGEQGKAIGALAAPFVAGRVGSALSPQMDEGMQLLVQHGYEPTLGQAVGGGMKRLETAPVTQLFTEGARANASQTLTVAAANRALTPLGLGPQALGKIDPKKLNGFQIYEKAEALASKAYDDILPQLNISLSGNTGVAFAKAASDLKAMMSPAGVKKLNEALAHLQKKGTTAITGEDMKLVDKALGQIRRTYIRAGQSDVEAALIGDQVTAFQGALRDMVATQNPQFAIPLQRANAAWNNLVRVQHAVEKAGNTEGFFTPQQLQAAVRQLETSGSGFSKSQATMQDISNAAIKTLPIRTQVPYSALNQAVKGGAGVLAGAGAGAGTAAAMGAGGAGMAAGAALPVLGGAGLYGALYSPFGQSVARSIYARQPGQLTGTLGEILRDTRINSSFATSLPQFQQGE